MPPTVKFEMPPELEEDELLEFVSSGIAPLCEAVDFEVSSGFGEAGPVESVRVTSVALSDDAVAVNYAVSYAPTSAPGGADAATGAAPPAGSAPEAGEERVMLGERRGRTLIFERFIPPPG